MTSTSSGQNTSRPSSTTAPDAAASTALPVLALLLTTAITAAMATWSATWRFTVVCVALALPTAAAIGLYLLLVR